MAANHDKTLWREALWIWHSAQKKMYNFHLLARKVFSLEAVVTKATCLVSANNAYELYTNERWVGRGPVRSYPRWQYYDKYDLTELLHRGDNVVALHAYNHGTEHPGVLHQTPGRGGLIVKITAQLANGSTATVVSDDSWRVVRAPQYSVDTGFITGHRQDYKEVYDAAQESQGWEELDFDDSDWLWRSCTGLAGRHVNVDKEVTNYEDRLYTPHRVAD